MPSRMPESPSTASTAAKTMLLLPVGTQSVLGEAAPHRGHPTGMEQHPPALRQGTNPSPGSLPSTRIAPRELVPATHRGCHTCHHP